MLGVGWDCLVAGQPAHAPPNNGPLQNASSLTHTVAAGVKGRRRGKAKLQVQVAGCGWYTRQEGWVGAARGKVPHTGLCPWGWGT